MRNEFTALILVAAWALPLRVIAEEASRAPQIAHADVGATVAAISMEASGNVKPDVARRYLTMRVGDPLEQAAIDRDFNNLETLAGLRPRLEIKPDGARAVTLHWTVSSRRIAPANYSFYGVPPLATTVGGAAFSLTAPLRDNQRSQIAATIQFTQRAGLAVFYARPLHLDAETGRESDMIVGVAGTHGLYRADQPEPVNAYSWTTAVEAAYLVRAASGTQLEIGARLQRSTSQEPTNITAPSVYDTYASPAKNVILEAGFSQACPPSPKLWHPPYCALQYRIQASDAIGAFGATNDYQLYAADIAHYTKVGSSTLALHAAGGWSQGVLPDSLLVCSNVFHGYPKPFCGTSAEIVQAEYRIADASPGPLKVVLFTETGASRVRDGDQLFASPTYQWHADSGIGLQYRGVRLNFGYGSQGGRLSIELQGQSF